MRIFTLAALAILGFTGTLEGQKAQKTPARNVLPATADTNDAIAYYHWGMSKLPRQPAQAADAFYWAMRLAPTWADPYYARRSALLMENRNSLWGYIIGQRGIVNSKRVQAIDSLAREALIRNPFIVTRLDRMMLEEALNYETDGQAYLSRMRSGDAGWDAWIAYGDGRYAEAARLYGDALKRRAKDYHYRLPRARAFFHLLEYDSAASELTMLVSQMRKEDDKTLVYFYDSKELFEYSLGRIYYLMDRHDDARAALGRALEEDLSFYMAHVDLAEIALKQGDTTTALSELALAAELRATDAGVRLRYGDALMAARQLDEAVVQYRAAIQQEPYFALPYYQLARALDAQGKASDAAEQYRAFVARSARNRDELAAAHKRIAELAAGSGGTP